jgi:hypothetical protein
VILECGPVPDSQKSNIVQLGPDPKERDAAFRRRASVDYAVREKLMNFASAATERANGSRLDFIRIAGSSRFVSWLYVCRAPRRQITTGGWRSMPSEN